MRRGQHAGELGTWRVANVSKKYDHLAWNSLWLSREAVEPDVNAPIRIRNGKRLDRPLTFLRDFLPPPFFRTEAM